MIKIDSREDSQLSKHLIDICKREKIEYEKIWLEIGDYVIGEQEEGRMVIEDSFEPEIPSSESLSIKLDDDMPIPEDLLDRSDLNKRYGVLPFTQMNIGQSFVLDQMTEKEYIALRARVSRANKRNAGRFALKQEDRSDAGVRGRVFRIE